jgi:hypothetical protein
MGCTLIAKLLAEFVQIYNSRSNCCHALKPKYSIILKALYQSVIIEAIAY